MLEDYVPVYDAAVVEKLYNEGVSLIGKSSMDELAMVVQQIRSNWACI